jgi:hypothetical protein
MKTAPVGDQASEKRLLSLPIHASHPLPPSPAKKTSTFLKFILLLSICFVSVSFNPLLSQFRPDWDFELTQDNEVCPQFPNLTPTSSAGFENAKNFIFSEEFRNLTVGQLSGAVQIETQSYDDLGNVGQDERFDHFFKVSFSSFSLGGSAGNKLMNLSLSLLNISLGAFQNCKSLTSKLFETRLTITSVSKDTQP